MSNCQYTLRYVPQRRRKFRKIIKKYLVMHARKKRSKGKNKTWTNAGTGEVLGFQSTTLITLVLSLPPNIPQGFFLCYIPMFHDLFSNNFVCQETCLNSQLLHFCRNMLRYTNECTDSY